MFDRDPENPSEGGQVIGLKRRATAFPSGVALLRDAELFRDLLLRKARFEAGVMKALAKSGASRLCRSSHCHVRSVRQGDPTYRKGLHDIQSIA